MTTPRTTRRVAIQLKCRDHNDTRSRALRLERDAPTAAASEWRHLACRASHAPLAVDLPWPPTADRRPSLGGSRGSLSQSRCLAMTRPSHAPATQSGALLRSRGGASHESKNPQHTARSGCAVEFCDGRGSASVMWRRSAKPPCSAYAGIRCSLWSRAITSGERVGGWRALPLQVQSARETRAHEGAMPSARRHAHLV